MSQNEKRATDRQNRRPPKSDDSATRQGHRTPATAHGQAKYPTIYLGLPSPPRWAYLASAEPRLRDIAAEARSRPWSIARYERAKRRISRLVGWHARDPRLASSAAYEVAVWHVAGLMRSRSRRRARR